jgi:hypothetical protein
MPVPTQPRSLICNESKSNRARLIATLSNPHCGLAIDITLMGLARVADTWVCPVAKSAASALAAATLVFLNPEDK